MKLIVGIGNPGKKYEKTRHNIGFMVLDSYAEAHGCPFQKSMDGLYAKIKIGEEEVILLKPQKYVNLSGQVVKKFMQFYQIDITDLLIISDDLDLSLGKYKLKEKGSSGGHNGLKNIEENLYSQEYRRLKVGIAGDENTDATKYVLTKLKKEEIDAINKIEFKNILDDFLISSFDKLMNKYNHK